MEPSESGVYRNRQVDYLLSRLLSVLQRFKQPRRRFSGVSAPHYQSASPAFLDRARAVVL